MVIEILLVEDSPSDAELMAEALEHAKHPNRLHIVEDGVEALQFLYRTGAYCQAPRPDLIVLDLNLPRKDGREVLAEIKSHPNLGTIPVVVLTTSAADEDILQAYRLHANCYIKKPSDFDTFMVIVQAFDAFWLDVVQFPPHSA